jgi:phosphatidylglycerophosphate synthase
MVAQFALLMAMAAGVGLGSAGWVTGATYAVTVWLLLSHALHRAGMRSLGPANLVTLARATLVGGVAAVVADSVGGSAPVGVLVTLATVALVLDAVDGQVARRTGTTSALGARFDMETDAFLILVLSVFVAGSLGLWVLAIGAFRYLFVAAAYLLPWLRAPLPPTLARKAVAAVQGIVLVVAGADVLSKPLAIILVGGALALLGWSFGRDIAWLWRAGRPEAVAAAWARDTNLPAQTRRRVHQFSR